MRSRNASPLPGARGFTLLELVIVITVIGILGTMVVVKVSSVPSLARAEKVKRDIRSIVELATMIEAITGEWPATIEDLRNPKSANGEKLPSFDGEDPWGHEYLYEVGEDGPVVRCLGKDGREGGEGENADMVYPRTDES